MQLEVQRLGIAELAVAHNPAILGCVGLGSCLAIGVYHGPMRVGGLAHAMLPESSDFVDASRETFNPAKYVDTAIEALVRALEALGCSRSSLVARVVGGGQMFPILAERMDIGRRNVAAAHRKLEELRIPIVGEDTGGSRGRTVYFDLQTGTMEVRFALEKQVLKI